MAIAADTVWQVDKGGTGASDNNGAGFAVSQKGATGTDHSIIAPTAFTVTTTGIAGIVATAGSFDNTMLGNVINIAGDGLYIITSFSDATHVTVDRNTGTAVGSSAVVGGAFLTWGKGITSIGTSNRLYVKYNASPYSVTTSTTLGASGTASAGDNLIYVTGYNTTRTLTNTDALRPTIQAGANSIFLLETTTQNYIVVQNLIFDGNGGSFTGITGLHSHASFVMPLNCRFTTFTSSQAILWVAGTLALFGCEVDHCGTASVYVVQGGDYSAFTNCLFHDNTAPVLNNGTYGISVVQCTFLNNTGGSTDCITCSVNTYVYGSTFANNGRDGIRASGLNQFGGINNCIFSGNGGYDIDVTGSVVVTGGTTTVNCAFKPATSGTDTGNVRHIGKITLSVDPFVNSATGNLALNATAGGGAAVLAAGYAPFGTLPTTSYTSPGTFQAQAGGGGGGGRIIGG